ncbi:Transcriptional regulator Myc-A [Cyphomyrmex costatus]|uniref:Transcriptional regulator Myc-A n=1 Tax=Cyphomyrmex costatus TaxID=456900 RepID=A0A195CWR0_9HYME|nr:Transcriptional regulator Myc-A [Cyphomyrmex costatus]
MFKELLRSQLNSQRQLQSDSQHTNQHSSEPNSQPDSQPDTQSDSQPDSQPNSQSDSHLAVQPNSQSNSQPKNKLKRKRTFSEADNCLYYLSDDEDDYITRCKKKAARGFAAATEEHLKELQSWKSVEQSDPFQTDFFEDELTNSRTAIREDQQVSFRHDQINVSEVMEHISVQMSPSLLEAPLPSETSYSSLEVSPESPSEVSSLYSEASTSSEVLGLPIATKNSFSNENIGQRITRRKHEEMQQRIAYNIKKNTLIDHCYHQTNVPETCQVVQKLEDSSEESEDEEGDEVIIDVVSVKSAKKQVSFAKQVKHFEYQEAQRKVKHEDSDENELPEPFISRRPRGRPPGSTKRKANRSGPAPKRVRIQNNLQLNSPQQPSYQCQNSMRQCALRRDSFEDTERRRLHNDMERQRRINMKESYEQLRRNVPAVACNDRASKVSILKQGTTYIRSLTEIGNTLKTNAAHLKQQNEMLKRRLQHLRNLSSVS